MTAPSFFEGVLVALIAALAGTLADSAVALVLPGTAAIRLVTGALALGYLLYLLGRSPERIGKVTTSLAWLAAAALLWVLSPPLPLYLAVHLALASILRSLYFHQAPLAALGDLVLTGLGLVAAAGAYLHTGSLFLAVWCLFLVMALFVFIPSSGRAKGTATDESDDRFGRAYRAAEAAVRRLSAIQ